MATICRQKGVFSFEVAVDGVKSPLKGQRAIKCEIAALAGAGVVAAVAAEIEDEHFVRFAFEQMRVEFPFDVLRSCSVVRQEDDLVLRYAAIKQQLNELVVVSVFGAKGVQLVTLKSGQANDERPR